MDWTFERIDEEREAAGISAAQLCRRADVSESTYYKTKKATNANTRKRTLTRLHRALVELSSDQAA